MNLSYHNEKLCTRYRSRVSHKIDLSAVWTHESISSAWDLKMIDITAYAFYVVKIPPKLKTFSALECIGVNLLQRSKSSHLFWPLIKKLLKIFLKFSRIPKWLNAWHRIRFDLLFHIVLWKKSLFGYFFSLFHSGRERLVVRKVRKQEYLVAWLTFGG